MIPTIAAAPGGTRKEPSMDVVEIIVIACCVLGILLGLASCLVQMAAGKHKPERFIYPSEKEIDRWA
jgi:hypothetical protein